LWIILLKEKMGYVHFFDNGHTPKFNLRNQQALAVSEFEETQLLRFGLLFCIVQKFSNTSLAFLKHFINSIRGTVVRERWYAMYSFGYLLQNKNHLPATYGF